ncbi:MAG: hypothetical protein ACLGHN_14935, partial [Bacteriovoracia bacterium]
WSKKFSQKELQNWMLDCQKKKLRLDQLTDALLAYGYFIGIALVNIFLILQVFFIHVLIFVVPAEIPGQVYFFVLAEA